MFFFFVFFAAGFILTALLSPKMKVENAKAATIDEFNFPRADEGAPVPRFYGTLKLRSPNTIGLSNFRADPIKKKVKTGLFSSKKVITGYKYFADIDLAWALGPGVVYRKMWFGDNLVWSGCLYGDGCVNLIPINLPELYGGSEDGKRGGIGGTVAMYCGDFDQPRDTWLEANTDPDVPAYVGVAHTVFRDFWWGNNPQIDAVSMECAYLTDTLGVGLLRHYMDNGLDMNPVCVLYDIMTYGWGNLGYDPDLINIDDWRLSATKIFGEGNGISLAITSATEAKDALKTILRQINATMFEDASTGLVELKLIRNDYNIDALPVLGPSQIGEVRNFTKKLWHETNNVVRLKYIDRAEDYRNDKIATAKDSSLLRFQGKERPVEVNMPGIKVAELANAIAARELSNLNVPLYSCQMTVNRTAASLKPGDVFKWTWPEYGVVQVVMRIQKMGLGTLEDGTISLDVVQDEFSSDAVVIAPPSPTGYTPTVLDPVDVVEFVIFELPAWLDYQASLGTREGHTRLSVFAAAPSNYTIGFNGYIEDDLDDATVITGASYSTMSELDGAIGRFDGWTTGTLTSVTVTTPSGTIAASGEPREGGGLFLIGDELFAYTSAVNSGGGIWTLSTVKRALLDTTWLEHATGARVWFFDGPETFFESDSPNGATDDVYLLDQTATGSSAVDSAIVEPFTNKGRIGLAIAPDYVTADASRAAWPLFSIGDTVVIDARPRNRNDVDQVWYEDDAAGTPEAGTTYRISFEVGGVVTPIDDEETLPYNLLLTSAMTGNCVILVEAKKDGNYSFSAAPFPLVVQSTPIMIDSVNLLIDTEEVYTT